MHILIKQHSKYRDGINHAPARTIAAERAAEAVFIPSGSMVAYTRCDADHAVHRFIAY